MTTNDQLSAMGMRVARENEAGWFVLVIVDNEVVKIWATDKD